MNCWALLGIERTTDTSVIRKAYKQQLLIYHPEDDPTGYQTIREAYARAMDEAKRRARTAYADADTFNGANENPITEVAADTDEWGGRLFTVNSDGFSGEGPDSNGGFEDEERPRVTRRYFSTEIENTTHRENDFMTRLARLYNDHNQRNHAEAWEELLNHDVLWDIQSKSAIDDRMLQFFSEHHNLKDDIWETIEMHTGLFYKLSKKPDEYSPYFVDTYALATQKLEVPRLAATPNVRIIKAPDVSWWRYCFSMPIAWIVLAVIGNVFVVPFYLFLVLIRIILLVKKRNWKIIMGEYTFTHINSWGKRYDFKYIDIIKIEQEDDIVIVYLKKRKIRIKAEEVQNLGQLLAKMSRYGRTDRDTIIMPQHPNHNR